MRFKKIIILTLIFTFLATSTGYSTSISDLNDKKQNISQDIQDLESNLAESKKEADRVNAELEVLEQELMTAVDELTKVTATLEDVSQQFEQSKIDLATAIDNRDKQEVILHKRLRNMYEYGNVSYLQILLSSRSIVDFINRAEYIRKVAEYDQNAYDLLQEYSLEVEKKTRELEVEKVEVEKQQKLQIQAKEEVESKVAAKEEIFRIIENDIFLYEENINKLEEASNEVERLIKAEEKRLADLARASTQNTTYTGGQLLWPVPSNTRISSNYGYRTHPVTGERYKLHAGMDVPASMGTPIVAAADGTVILAGYNGGYGYCVIISHGGGLSTLYGHNSSLNVSVGQKVTRGQQIALSGNTGLSTGPHLHFEVRVNGTAKDPLPYLKN